MKFVRAQEFTGTKPWDAMPIANMNGVTTRLHWSDQPYTWHTNDGEEVFVVLDGNVDMHYRQDGVELIESMSAGDIFFAAPGTEHVAHPIGEARMLVVEREGSE